MIWSDAFLQKLVTDAEENICASVNLTLKREALAVTSGVSTYILSEGFKEMLLVCWKGTYLQPLTQYELTKYDANYLNSTGTPVAYSCHKDGENKIRFYPVVNETINSTVTDIYSLDSNDKVTLTSFYNPSRQNTVLTVPNWISRYLIKYYVLYQSFLVEGKGQNIKLADIYKKRYLFFLSRLHLANANLKSSVEMDNKVPLFLDTPQRAMPLLPVNFGADRSPL